MRAKILSALSCFVIIHGSFAATLETKPNDPYFARIEPIKAPATSRLLLKKGDRLAIIGDSITEQKLYSRMIETYLTVCTPELEITARQYGWSGERATGFLARMTNDCLRFDPTIATTCYGMNDHEYIPYQERIGKTYREKQTAIVDSFKANRVRVILGSPGPVGKMPSWVRTATGTVADLNENLCKLRNIDLEIAKTERVAFADVFWP
ncbi:MAG: SGNH/GDSL hydrolase family protein, partial [Opitutaceae bacterium]|nr:SGNH/GDSL hydrolase family protein [Verrucomicrobiales bacterium]